MAATNGEQPLISVVIPTYNRGEELETAVESVLDQTYKNVELIVVDDHSPIPAEETLGDSSMALVSSFACIRHAENRGANAARNTGIEAASGEYVAFLDDDDWWEPEKLEKQLDAFRNSGEETGVVYVGRRFHFADGTTTVRTPAAGGDLTKTLLMGNCVGSFSAVMVRTEAIEESGLPDERLPNAQDKEWYIRLSRNWQFVAVPEPLVNIREGDQSADQLSHDLDKRKDVSYPLIVEKHRSLAREYGVLCERRMVAQLAFQIGYRAFWRQRFNTARLYMLKATASYPFDWKYYVGFLAALVGKPLVSVNERVDSDAKRRLREAYFTYLH